MKIEKEKPKSMIIGHNQQQYKIQMVGERLMRVQ